MSWDPKIILGAGALAVGTPLVAMGMMHDRDQALNHQVVVTAELIGKDRRCDTNTTTHTREDGSTYTDTDVECIDYIHTTTETFKNVSVGWVGKGQGDVIRLQGSLRQGQTYKFTVYGKSNPQWGQFRTVIGAEPVSTSSWESSNQ